MGIIRTGQKFCIKQGQGYIVNVVEVGVCSSGILYTLLTTWGQGRKTQTAGVGRKKSKNIQWMKKMGQHGHLSLLPPFLWYPVIFPMFGSLSCSLGEAGCGLLGLGHSKPIPVFLIVHFFTAATWKFCNRDRKGGGPLDSLTHTHTHHF